MIFVRRRKIKNVYEMVVFAMLGSLMFCSKIFMEALPNIHLLGMFTIVFTIVYRFKALIPIYIYVLMNGVYSGFSMWWVPYTYIWTVLWGLAMLVPPKTPRILKCIIYPLLCALHGLAFGILYAPVQALMVGMNFEQMLAWIAAGLSFDILHAVGNFAAGFLIVPLSELIIKLSKNAYRL